MSNYEDYDSINNAGVNEPVHRSRREKKKEEEKKAKRSSSGEKSSGGGGKKKYRLNWKQFIKFLLCIFLICALAVIIYVAIVIAKAPEITTDNIYGMLSQSSVLYDDEGNVIDSIYGDQNRTIVEISEIPKEVQDAFIALEDKTFRTHSGFNIIRIFGAIKDAVLNGGHISGTSTITQQLARNLYLPDKMFTRSLNRKITEAYYAIILERKLTKDQILEAYLNTINFGCGYGIQSAAQAYFSKDVSELTLYEAAALAAMPQAPSLNALVLQVSSENIDKDADNIIKKAGEYTYVWNDTAASRIKTCLKLMLEQELISQAEYDEAVVVEIKDMVNPNLDALNTVSNYFADYVIKTVISDLQEQYGYDYSKASDLVYNGGLQIYTTLDSQAQEVIEKEFKNDSNFPNVVGIRKNNDGNIIDDNGNVLLYAYSNYFDSDNKFTLKSSEFKWNDDGSLTIFAEKRLNIYNTTVQGTTDYSVEFKNLFLIEDGTFYSIAGGYINIPQKYKSRDLEDNLVVSADFFTDYPEFFVKEGEKLSTTGFTLNQRVIQPQSAMTIIDNSTGQVKAMIGGRKTSGRMLYNRAAANRQPGSSIKPLAVYSAALQRSYELQKAGQLFPYVDYGIDKQGTSLWGDYLTAGSIVDDEPTRINGKYWPKNSYSGYRGLYTLRTALQQSVNVCAVKILLQVGVDYSYDLLQKYGITSLVPSGDANDKNLASLGLGGLTKGASTLEMASAYTTFVNDGIHKSYSVYTKITYRNGDVLLEPNVTETEVLNSGVAWITRNMLQTVVSEGIGRNAAISGEKVGGKTGTTSDKFDIWFDGFTANYSASLWIGNDVNIQLSSMSNIAASLWSKVMGQIDGAKGGTYSAKPSNVIQVAIDTKSGMLATKDSTSTRSEYFTKGTQPTEAGTIKQNVLVCLDSGCLATPSCTNTKKYTGYLRPYLPSDKTSDADNELPHYYCYLHNPDPDTYPVEEGKEVTIVPIPGTEDPEEPGDTPEDNPDGESNPGDGSGEGSDPGDNPDGESEPDGEENTDTPKN